MLTVETTSMIGKGNDSILGGSDDDLIQFELGGNNDTIDGIYLYLSDEQSVLAAISSNANYDFYAWDS